MNGGRGKAFLIVAIVSGDLGWSEWYIGRVVGEKEKHQTNRGLSSGEECALQRCRWKGSLGSDWGGCLLPGLRMT